MKVESGLKVADKGSVGAAGLKVAGVCSVGAVGPGLSEGVGSGLKVAVYAGSFNPLHIGHLSIMRYLTQVLDFDVVYLIVSPKNPLKDSVSEDTGRARYDAAVAAVARHPELRVRVDDIELNMPAPQYTIRTLDALQAREPANRFTLVIGADNLVGIHRWRDYQRILTDYGVAVYPRPGFDMVSARDALMQECGWVGRGGGVGDGGSGVGVCGVGVGDGGDVCGVGVGDGGVVCGVGDSVSDCGDSGAKDDRCDMPDCGASDRFAMADEHGWAGEYRIQLIDAPMVDVSSTQLREAIAAGRDVSGLLM